MGVIRKVRKAAKSAWHGARSKRRAIDREIHADDRRTRQDLDRATKTGAGKYVSEFYPGLKPSLARKIAKIHAGLHLNPGEKAFAVKNLLQNAQRREKNPEQIEIIGKYMRDEYRRISVWLNKNPKDNLKRKA